MDVRITMQGQLIKVELNTSIPDYDTTTLWHTPQSALQYINLSAKTIINLLQQPKETANQVKLL